MNIDQLSTEYNNLLGHKNALQKHVRLCLSNIESYEKELAEWNEVLWLFSQAATLTREKFSNKAEELVNLVVNCIFSDRDFKFKLDFYEGRGQQTECSLLIEEGGSEYLPEDEMGGSILDIIGLAFRPVLWSLEENRSRAIFQMDEPARYVGKENIQQVGEIIHILSHQLNIQFLITTHEEMLGQYGDRSFGVKHSNGKSVVEVIGGVEIERSQKDIQPKQPRADKKRSRPSRSTGKSTVRRVHRELSD